MKKSAKIIHLRLSIGADDIRTMDQFKKDVLNAVGRAKPKNTTLMGEEHIVDGQRYSVPEYEALLKEEQKELRRMLAQEAEEAEAVAEGNENASS